MGPLSLPQSPPQLQVTSNTKHISLNRRNLFASHIHILGCIQNSTDYSLLDVKINLSDLPHMLICQFTVGWWRWWRAVLSRYLSLSTSTLGPSSGKRDYLFHVIYSYLFDCEIVFFKINCCIATLFFLTWSMQEFNINIRWGETTLKLLIWDWIWFYIFYFNFYVHLKTLKTSKPNRD